MFRKNKKPKYTMVLKNTYITKDKFKIFKLRGDWEISNTSTGKPVDVVMDAALFQAKKALRWWNKYGTK